MAILRLCVALVSVLPAVADRGEQNLHSGDHHALQLTSSGKLVVEKKWAARTVVAGSGDGEADEEVGQMPRWMNISSTSALNEASTDGTPFTGGTCRVFPCASWRGKTTCHRHKCYCEDGWVSVKGKCVDPNVAELPDRDIKLMSYNVFYGNNHFKEIAEIIRNVVRPDIVNLQEATGNIATEVVKALNAMGGPQWALANPWSTDHHWCGLNVYRSDKWSVQWHKELGVQQGGDSRGVCGALMRRKKDGVKLCVFGAHPIYVKMATKHSKGDGDPKWAKDAIIKSAEMMKECSAAGAQTAFVCDCNTVETKGIKEQLEFSTGWKWRTAFADAFDKIFLQVGTGADAMTFKWGRAVSPSWPRYQQKHGQKPEWGYSDHPPVYADLTPGKR